MLGFAALQALPFGTPAARVTFVSVLSSAGASALVYCTIVHILRALQEAEAARGAREERGTRPGVAEEGAACGGGQGPGSGEQVDARASALLGAGLYSFSPLVWTYSTQAEVFALNNWFAAALILLTAMYMVPLPPSERSEPAGKPANLAQPDPAAAPERSAPSRARRMPSGLQHRCGSGGERRTPPSEDASTQGAGDAAAGLRLALTLLAMTEQRLQEVRAPGAVVLGGYYWTSENLRSCETLMMIVPGSGSPDAGLWSTLGLLREAGPDIGSVLAYLEHARRLGWGTVVLCPNANFQPSAQDSTARAESRRALPGSESAEAHAVSVWEQVVKPTTARVLIVAHSTGGAAALHIASCDPLAFAARVHAIALLDSVHKKLPTTDAGVRDLCRTRACNFVASAAPLGNGCPKPWHSQAPVVAAGCICKSGGHTDHARVPAAALPAVFDFLSHSLGLDVAAAKCEHHVQAADAADAAHGHVTSARQACSIRAASCKAGDGRDGHICRRAWWIPYAGAWLIGLGLTNQHTLVLLALPLALAILIAGHETLVKPGAMLTLVGCGLMGLLPYAYLVMAGEQPQRGAWGDPAQLRGLWVHLLRREYGTWKLFSGSDGQQQGLQSLVTGTQLYLQDLPHQQLFMGPLCTLCGAGLMLRAPSTRALAATLLLAWGGYTIVFHSLANLPLEHARHGKLFRSVHARFWLQANTILAVFLGVGVLPCMRGVGAGASLLLASPRVRPSACWAAAAAVVGLQISLQYAECDKSQEWAIWEAGHATLMAVPRNGLLLVKGDLNTNAVRYLMECEGARPDVQQLDLSHVSYTWFNRRHARAWHSNVTLPGRRFTRLHRQPPAGAYLLRHLLRANIRRKPIVITSGLESLDPEIFTEFVLWPSGVGYRVYPRLQPPAPRAWLRDNALRLPILPSDFVASSAESGLWEDIANRDAAIAHAQVASHMLVVPPDASPTSPSPSPDASPVPPSSHNDGRGGSACMVTIPRGGGGSTRGKGGREGAESGSGTRELAVCGTIEGVEVGRGDGCNLAYLEACQDVLEGQAPLEQLSWFSCAAQVPPLSPPSRCSPPPPPPSSSQPPAPRTTPLYMAGGQDQRQCPLRIWPVLVLPCVHDTPAVAALPCSCPGTLFGMLREDRQADVLGRGVYSDFDMCSLVDGRAAAAHLEKRRGWYWSCALVRARCTAYICVFAFVCSRACVLVRMFVSQGEGRNDAARSRTCLCFLCARARARARARS